jgi:hypothetical protein
MSRGAGASSADQALPLTRIAWSAIYHAILRQPLWCLLTYVTVRSAGSSRLPCLAFVSRSMRPWLVGLAGTWRMAFFVDFGTIPLC